MRLGHLIKADLLNDLKFFKVYNDIRITGVRSYGKAVYFFGPVPLICYAIFATKVLGLFPLQSFQDWLYDQDWSSYIYNAKVDIQNKNSTIFKIHRSVLGLCCQRVLPHLVFPRRQPPAVGGPQQVPPQPQA